MPTLRELTTKAQNQVGNGIITYGFLEDVDPGLPRAEYVNVPFGSTKITFATRASDVEAAGYHNDFFQCLLYDCGIVANKGIPDVLKPFAAANRAAAYASGFLTDEVVVPPTELTGVEKQALVDANPHVELALDIPKQLTLYASYVTSVCYWSSNHNTSGRKLPPAFVKVMRTSLSLDPAITTEAITDAVYFAGHASDKRLTLRAILSATIAASLRAAQSFKPTYLPGADQWAKLRIGKGQLPAGVATMGLLKVCLSHVCKCGLAGFEPAPQAIADLTAAFVAVSANPGRYHPGATYLFGSNVIALAELEDLKVYLGVFAGFCREAGRATSVTTLPHVVKLIDAHNRNDWTQIGKKFMAGVVLDTAKVDAALATYGLGTAAAIPSPVDDAAGYKASADILRDTLDALEL